MHVEYVNEYGETMTQRNPQAGLDELNQVEVAFKEFAMFLNRQRNVQVPREHAIREMEKDLQTLRSLRVQMQNGNTDVIQDYNAVAKRVNGFLQLWAKPGLVTRWRNWMRANLDKHPLYSGVGK